MKTWSKDLCNSPTGNAEPSLSEDWGWRGAVLQNGDQQLTLVSQRHSACGPLYLYLSNQTGLVPQTSLGFSDLFALDCSPSLPIAFRNNNHLAFRDYFRAHHTVKIVLTSTLWCHRTLRLLFFFNFLALLLGMWYLSSLIPSSLQKNYGVLITGPLGKSFLVLDGMKLK